MCLSGLARPSQVQPQFLSPLHVPACLPISKRPGGEAMLHDPATNHTRLHQTLCTIVGRGCVHLEQKLINLPRSRGVIPKPYKINHSCGSYCTVYVLPCHKEPTTLPQTLAPLPLHLENSLDGLPLYCVHVHLYTSAVTNLNFSRTHIRTGVHSIRTCTHTQ